MKYTVDDINNLFDRIKGIIERNPDLIEEAPEEKPIRYMRPKMDRDRVFHFVKCEYYGLGAWMSGKLVFSFKDSIEPFHFLTNSGLVVSSNVRIPEFSPENPPPKNTKIGVNGMDNSWETRHFSHFVDGWAHYFICGSTSHTEHYTIRAENYTFVYPESDYEWVEE